MSDKKRFFNEIVKAVRGGSHDQQPDDFPERISKINSILDDAEKKQATVTELRRGMESLRKDVEDMKKKINVMPEGGIGDIRKELNRVSDDAAKKINSVNSRIDAMGMGEVRNEIEALRKDAALTNDDKETIRKLQESVDSINSKTCNTLTSKDIESIKKASEDARICANRILDKKIENLGKGLDGFSNSYRSDIGSINSRIDGMPDGEAMDDIKTAVESLIKDVDCVKRTHDGADEKIRKAVERIDSINAQIGKMQHGKEIELLKKELADAKKEANAAIDNRIESVRKEMKGVSDDATNKIYSKADAAIVAGIKNEVESLKKDFDSHKAEKSISANEWNEAMKKLDKGLESLNSRINGMMSAKDADEFRKEIEMLKKGIADDRKGAISERNALWTELGKIAEGMRVNDGSPGEKTGVMTKADLRGKDHEAGKANEGAKMAQDIERRDNGRRKAEPAMIAGAGNIVVQKELTADIHPLLKGNSEPDADISRLKKRYEIAEGKVEADRRAGRDVSREEALLQNASFELTVAELCLLEGDTGPCRQRAEKAGEILEKVM